MVDGGRRDNASDRREPPPDLRSDIRPDASNGRQPKRQESTRGDPDAAAVHSPGPAIGPVVQAATRRPDAPDAPEAVRAGIPEAVQRNQGSRPAAARLGYGQLIRSAGTVALVDRGCRRLVR